MKTLIVKLGAAGDVVRTTSVLNVIEGDIDWITSDCNLPLLRGLKGIRDIIPESKLLKWKSDKYDLVINLEDSIKSGLILNNIKYKELFGAYLTNNGKLNYTENSAEWFDLSLISKYGLEKANQLKYENKRSFQEIVFEGLGYKFNSEPYLLPYSAATDLHGDIAISPKAGKVWPMKNWAYYDELAELLKQDGFTVNFLPQRSSMIQHLADIRAHRYLISGDSLPMHFALGSGVQSITLFICTSAPEIYDYGIQRKIVSPGLKEYFYRRDLDKAAQTSIPLFDVYNEFVSLIKMGKVL